MTLDESKWYGVYIKRKEREEKQLNDLPMPTQSAPIWAPRAFVVVFGKANKVWKALRDPLTMWAWHVSNPVNEHKSLTTREGVRWIYTLPTTTYLWSNLGVPTFCQFLSHKSWIGCYKTNGHYKHRKVLPLLPIWFVIYKGGRFKIHVFKIIFVITYTK
jgi:hypothetical protein